MGTETQVVGVSVGGFGDGSSGFGSGFVYLLGLYLLCTFNFKDTISTVQCTNAGSNLIAHIIGVNENHATVYDLPARSEGKV